MTKADHSEALAEARKRILELEREKLRIEADLAAWISIRDGHLALIGKEGKAMPPDSPIGPVEAIRVILSNNPEGLSTIKIRDELKNYGVRVGSGNHYMSNIMTLLKKDKHIEVVQVPGGKIYRLKNDAP